LSVTVQVRTSPASIEAATTTRVFQAFLSASSDEEAGQVIAALRRGLDEAERRLLRQKPEKPHFAFE
jgi:hypothetical protein